MVSLGIAGLAWACEGHIAEQCLAAFCLGTTYARGLSLGYISWPFKRQSYSGSYLVGVSGSSRQI